jgi:phosphate transport system permease protein
MTEESSSNKTRLLSRGLTGGIRPPVKSDLGYTLSIRAGALIFGAAIVLFVWSILHQSLSAWTSHGFHILTGTVWSPSTSNYGALPLILATLITTAVALLVAVPIGLGTSLTIIFFLPQRLKTPMTSLVELLAAVPSVVYGLWGLFVLVPWMNTTIEPKLASITGGGFPFNGATNGFGLLLASIVLSVMILPTIVAISRDVIAAVPHEQIEGALSLGATKSQTLLKVVLPEARTGIFGAITLGAGRALGETIAVAMVIGSNPQIPKSLFSTGATLSSTIATEFGEASGAQLAALGALALILMVITAGVNAGARSLTRRAIRGHA